MMVFTGNNERTFLKAFFLWNLRLLAYLWSGWGAIASLFLLIALWDALAHFFGSLILASPLETFNAANALITENKQWLFQFWQTSKRALLGLFLALLAGSILGSITGRFLTAFAITKPWITVMTGTPAIAWLVMAMLWFGTHDATVIFTVFIACFPVIFIAAVQGVKTIDARLYALAASLKLPIFIKIKDVYLPHILSYILPAFTVALGNSWRVAVMAELLSSDTGVGAALAASRAQLDISTVLAWIAFVVIFLLIIEYIIFEPIKRELEKWRI